MVSRSSPILRLYDSADESGSQARITLLISVALLLLNNGRNVFQLKSPHPSYQSIWSGNIQLLLSACLPTQKSSNREGMINSIFNRDPTLTLNLELRLSKTANTQRTYSQPGEKGREKARDCAGGGRKTDMNYKEKVP